METFSDLASLFDSGAGTSPFQHEGALLYALAGVTCDGIAYLVRCRPSGRTSDWTSDFLDFWTYSSAQDRWQFLDSVDLQHRPRRYECNYMVATMNEKMDRMDLIFGYRFQEVVIVSVCLKEYPDVDLTFPLYDCPWCTEQTHTPALFRVHGALYVAGWTGSEHSHLCIYQVDAQTQTVSVVFTIAPQVRPCRLVYHRARAHGAVLGDHLFLPAIDGPAYLLDLMTGRYVDKLMPK